MKGERKRENLDEERGRGRESRGRDRSGMRKKESERNEGRRVRG